MTNVQFEAAKRQLEAAIEALDRPAGQAGVAATAKPSAPPADAVQTLTRLLVGASLLGLDELERRAAEWERRANTAIGTDGGVSEEVPVLPAPTATVGTAMRQALAGWLFAGQDRLREADDPGAWLRAASGHVMESVAAVTSETLGPSAATNRVLTGWIARGQQEEQRSKQLARIALADITREALDYLAHDEALQELVQRQSSGLAAELLEEVRERAVSADVTVDRLVGRLFRRRARLSEEGAAARKAKQS